MKKEKTIDENIPICCICDKKIIEESQIINGNWYHNKCIEKEHKTMVEFDKWLLHIVTLSQAVYTTMSLMNYDEKALEEEAIRGQTLKMVANQFQDLKRGSKKKHGRKKDKKVRDKDI